MRMWMSPPSLLCDQHLLGEHVEIHMFVGTIRKGVSIQGYLDNGLLEPTQIRNRHEALAREMKRRHMTHKSPLPDFPQPDGPTHVVDPEKSMQELHNRCSKCRALLDGNKPKEPLSYTILEEEEVLEFILEETV